MIQVLLAPHPDDETLWTSFTIQRENPLVIIVYDSYVQVERGHPECDHVTRRGEAKEALWELVGEKRQVEFCGLRDNNSYDARDVARAITSVLPTNVSHCWSPAWENGGHAQHNRVAEAAALLFMSDRIHHYLTYTNRGKSRSPISAPILDGSYIRRKLAAMACHKTQIENMALGTWPHYLDLLEYYV